jgi:uncharacterized membrane protein YvlD (DUF360 family)
MCIILAITAALTPGFTISGIWGLVFAVIVIILLDYILAKAFNLQSSKMGAFGRGIVGFVLTAIIIYVTQFFVPGFQVGVISAIIAALIYGILDAIIPGETKIT